MRRGNTSSVNHSHLSNDLDRVHTAKLVLEGLG